MPINMTDLVKLEELNRAFTLLITAELKKQKLDVGFGLFMFTLGDDSAMTWASNAARKDTIEALKEFIAKNETGDSDELGQNNRWDNRN